MDKLQITTEFGNITLPRSFYTVGSEEISKVITMASGKIVQDIIGSRTIINASFSYIPAADLANLIKAQRSGAFLPVTYTDTDGQEKTENMKMAPVAPTVFKFKDGVPVWVGVELELRAQEVN